MKYKKIYIELTNICGLKCTFCPPPQSKPSTMSVKDFEHLLPEVKTLTKLITFHVGGDPLVLLDLAAYLDAAHAHGLRVELSTSGFYMAKHPQETLLHPALKQLNFSLNSYNKNMTGITLDAYLEPIFQICAAKQKNDAMFINLRLWNSSTHDAEFNAAILDKITDHFGVVINRRCRENVRVAPKIIVAFDEYFEWPSMSGKGEEDGFCYGLDSHFAILSDGRVVPCCMDKEGVIALGNVYEKNLAAILKGDISQKIKEGFAKDIAVEALCQKCSYKNRFKAR